jgi:hypothetical protein
LRHPQACGARSRGGPEPSERGLARLVVALHSQALAPEPPLGIRSSDPMAVRSWLAEQVGFIVPVENPTGEGFALDGARAGQVGRRKAAVLVYRCEARVITLFIWRRSTPPGPRKCCTPKGVTGSCIGTKEPSPAGRYPTSARRPSTVSAMRWAVESGDWPPGGNGNAGSAQETLPARNVRWLTFGFGGINACVVYKRI